MPNRFIKESITTSETLALLSGDEERHCYRLIVQADDYGRFDARSHVIRARAYAAMLDQVSQAEAERRTMRLAEVGLIKLYLHEGKRYGVFVTWDKHQQIRAKTSKYPDPDGPDITRYHVISHAPVYDNVNVYDNENTPSVVSPFPGADAPAPLETPVEKKVAQGKRGQKTGVPTLSQGSRAAMHERFDSVLGAALVEEQIELALAHKSATKYTNVTLYVQNWLRRECNGRAPPTVNSGQHNRGAGGFDNSIEKFKRLAKSDI